MSSTLYTLRGRSPGRQSATDRLFSWAREHRAQLGLALGLSVLAGGFAALIIVNRGRLADRGADQLTMARMQLSAGRQNEAFQILDEVIKGNRVNPVGLQAAVIKGDAFMQTEKFADASAVYEEAYTRTNHPAYKPILLAGMAAAAVEMKMHAEAVRHFQLFLKDYPEHLLAPRAYMELGRLHRALNAPEESRKVFEKVVALYPKSLWAAEAQSEMGGGPAPRNS
ncbi:MAG: tetratricopeptide repeat protein [Elusimicrobia bacterium]|nr:tetratricopeptide repeat protein [Elusimicrobiota bacterium]